MARCKPAKNGRSDNGGSAASMMIKLAKIWREKRIGIVGIAFLLLVGDILLDL